jgi:MFS family permease
VTLAPAHRQLSRSRTPDRLPRFAVIAVFFVHGLLFASWAAHIPQVKEHLRLGVGSLGFALLGAPIGSVLAIAVAARLLPRLGSRRMVRVALLGYCASGPIIGLAGSLATFVLAFGLWGFFQGALDVSMNTQAISVERFSARVLMPGFHGSWSVGALAGAAVGALAVGLGISLSEQLLVLATPCLFLAGWLTTRMIPDRKPEVADPSRRHSTDRGGIMQKAVIVLGAIVLADMLCEGAAADWAAVYLHGSLHAAPVIAGLAYTAYALTMTAVRLSGNRLLTRFARNRLLPLLAGIATVGFAAGLLIDRPASVLVGFAFLGAGLACVVPTILSAAGDVANVDAGRAVAVVAGCGWAGFVVGPVLLGAIAASTSLRAALFVIPFLTAIVTLATGSAHVLRTDGPGRSDEQPTW